MTEAAIDALRVDLTRLLLSARSSDAVNKLNTDKATTLFRRCKHNEDRGSAIKSTVPSAEGMSAAVAAVPRKSPLPEEVDRCVHRVPSLFYSICGESDVFFSGCHFML